MMPWLARWKRKLAVVTSSASLKADAAESALCGYMAWIALAGLMVNAVWNKSEERNATNSRPLPARTAPCYRYGLGEVHSFEASAGQRAFLSERSMLAGTSSPRKTTSESSTRMRLHLGSESVGKLLNTSPESEFRR
jgi:hypothetical protein